ncbi:MAG: TIGR00366 family protein [Deltaproteobacteria bacterium]|nr:TIGR00366 family protein [Deltaproteobacteria bacterium]
MISRLGKVLSHWAARLVPDPFVLALGLTLAVGLLGLALTGGELFTVGAGFVSGFSSPGLLGFALQMCLVLVTGHALALSPPVQRAVARLARLPRSAGSAALIVAAVACLAGVAHWGLGAIVGAFLAREMGRHAAARGLKLHYPLLGGAAYSGLAVWHGGFSGSAPLKVAEAGHFTEAIVGVLPITETLFSPLNLVVTGALLLLIPALYYGLTPRDEAELVAPDLPPFEEEAREREPIDSVPAWLQESPLVGVGAGAAGLALLLALIVTDRLGLDLNSVNLFFLFLGLALQARLRRYVEAVADGARGAGAIILQFPFYFGILGMMKASGMIDWISETMVSIATASTFPTLAFLSAGLVNLLVPSGGGQWAVQGEILLSAGKALGVAPGTTVMAFAYGDAWTNMLQPFWALPLLGIMGLKAREIIGYTAVVFLLMALVVPALLLLMA